MYTQDIHFTQPIAIGDRTTFENAEDFLISLYRAREEVGVVDYTLYQASAGEVTDELLLASKIALAKDRKYFTNL
jgi:hypothetical protein